MAKPLGPSGLTHLQPKPTWPSNIGLLDLTFNRTNSSWTSIRINLFKLWLSQLKLTLCMRLLESPF